MFRYVMYSPEEIDTGFKSSPFKLKKDTKELSKEDLSNISQEIMHELNLGFRRKSCALFYNKGKKYALGIVKVRCGDEKSNQGKSNGYRCIVLVDEQREIGYLLHIYKHSQKANITRKEKNSLKKLVDEYIDSTDGLF